MHDNRDIGKEISEYMLQNSNFREQPDSMGKRFHLIKEGVPVAYLAFKHAFGGWRIWFLGKDGHHDIRSIDELKQICDL